MLTEAAIPVCRRHFPEERRRRTIRRVSLEQKIKVLSPISGGCWREMTGTDRHRWRTVGDRILL